MFLQAVLIRSLNVSTVAVRSFFTFRVELGEGVWGREPFNWFAYKMMIWSSNSMKIWVTEKGHGVQKGE